MKHIFILAVLSVLLGSCTKNEIVEVREIREVVREEVNQAFSINYDLTNADWHTDGHIFWADMNIPEIDNYYFNHGGVHVYIMYDNAYEALPQVFEGLAYGVLHSEGLVTIEVSRVDGIPMTSFNGVARAKIVLIDAVDISLNKDLDFTNFGAVQKAFNIKELR